MEPGTELAAVPESAVVVVDVGFDGGRVVVVVDSAGRGRNGEMAGDVVTLTVVVVAWGAVVLEDGAAVEGVARVARAASAVVVVEVGAGSGTVVGVLDA